MPQPLRISGDQAAPISRWADSINTELTGVHNKLGFLSKGQSSTADAVDSLTTDSAIPPDPTGVSISQTGLIIDGVLESVITAGYTSPNPLGNFRGVFLVITGYHGNANPVKVGEDNFTGVGGTAKTFKIPLDKTGETVTFYFVAKNTTEFSRTDWTNAPSVGSIVLNASATAPATPTGLAVTAVPIGLAVSWNENTEANIQSYNIWRNTSNSFGTATNIGSAAATGTGKVQFSDNNVTVGTTYWYFITAVNTAFTVSNNSSGVSGVPTTVSLDTQVADGSTFGRTPLGLTGADGRVPATAGRNLVYNGDLLIHTPPTGVQSAYASSIRVDDPDTTGAARNATPNGWTRNFETAFNGEGVFYRTDLSSFGFVPGLGVVMQDRQGSTGDAFSVVSDAFAVAPGTTYKYSANIFPGLGGMPAHATWYFRVFFYKTNASNFSRSGDLSTNTPTGTGLGSGFVGGWDIVAGSTSSTQAVYAANLTTPSDAGYARILFYHWTDGTIPSSVWNLCFGDVRCIQISNLDDEVSDGSTYGRTTFNQVTGAGLAFTNINSDNTYSTIPYHGSAFRALAVSNPNGNASTTSGSATGFVTVASFILNIPAGFTSYKGTLTVTKTGNASAYTIQGRLKIGAAVSNIIAVSSPSAITASGTVTVTGLTGGTQITVEVQANADATTDIGTHNLTCNSSFAQVQYTDQDITNLQ